ncbi:DUF2196 domain-containing protein [Lacrimispora amygdalina]|uniref:DUF2196 domain-containing protein n=1 Tax=Lacrimispora amygdalina TaxID=253257 RepID=A0A3E2N9B6_9FIRM|nr:DUF2196 domain-containing protein [Clostridium indicum]RFZ77597.1 DUF2196 domain-containing protein [Clostridium indicum]
MNGQNRTDVNVGAKVKIVLKADQKKGRLFCSCIIFPLLDYNIIAKTYYKCRVFA